MYKKQKITAILALTFMFLSLLPILLLGRYNHPTGDDYFYGVEGHRIWSEQHDLPGVLGAAAEGVATQYQIWQGTYSAMFLMYLAPNVFGENVYHLVTPLILGLFLLSSFALGKSLLGDLLKLPTPVYLTLSAIWVTLCIQTVDFQPESFFWYNGSMYYTGFFSVSLLYFALICGNITSTKSKESRFRQGFRIFLTLFAAVFLAGGNYVSFLPTLLASGCIALWLFLAGNRKAGIITSVSTLCLLAGFYFSATAPGNRIRQNDMWKIPATTAILKSLRQGMLFLKGWLDPWWIAALLLFTVLFWKGLSQTSFRFPLPGIVIGISYGIFCSMACPTFYTMNSTGPGRAVAIMYYGFAFFVFFAWAYLVGYVKRVLRKSPRKVPDFSVQAGVLLLVCLCLVTVSRDWKNLTAVRALHCLASGQAQAYEAEYRARLQILQDPAVTDVVFTPYEHPADLLYVGDFSGDPSDPTNKRVAEYFGKASLRVNWEQ